MSSIDDLLLFEWTDTEQTDNETTFNIDDAPDGKRVDGDDYREFYKRLAGLNAGTHTGKWRHEEVFSQTDGLRVFDAVVSQLELTPYQKEEAKRIFSDINQDWFGFYPEIVAFCVAAAVCERDGRVFRLPEDGIWHPETDSEFARFATRQEYDENTLRACWRAVRKVVGNE